MDRLIEIVDGQTGVRHVLDPVAMGRTHWPIGDVSYKNIVRKTLLYFGKQKPLDTTINVIIYAEPDGYHLIGLRDRGRTNKTRIFQKDNKFNGDDIIPGEDYWLDDYLKRFREGIISIEKSEFIFRYEDDSAGNAIQSNPAEEEIAGKIARMYGFEKI